MKTSVRYNIDNLKLSDVYSLMLFAMYKIQDIPEYAVLSELCYLLDGHGINRLMTYFAGKTVTFPSEEEFVNLANALLLYQYINIENKSMGVAQELLAGYTAKQKEAATDLYLKLIPIMKQYNINRGQIRTNGQ